jgi:hypothetical protein
MGEERFRESSNDVELELSRLEDWTTILTCLPDFGCNEQDNW